MTIREKLRVFVVKVPDPRLRGDDGGEEGLRVTLQTPRLNFFLPSNKAIFSLE